MLNYNQIYLFITGPLFILSLLIFLSGTVYQIFWFVRATRKVEPFIKNKIPGKKSNNENGNSYSHRFNLLINKGIKTNHVTGFVSLIFHLSLILTPFIIFPHHMILKSYLNITLFSVSTATADILTIIVLVSILYFLLRRIFIKQVKAITSFNDFFILLITAAPFITGFISYHQFFNSEITTILHVLSGEIMLAAIPFTKLVHMIFFFINRFTLVKTENSLREGNRIWQ